MRETLCKGLKDEDIVNGTYRDPKLILKMAQFHLSANIKWKDKLNWFGTPNNCSEDCEPVCRYVALLERQMTEIEGKMFSVEIEGMEKFVSFNLNCYQMT